MVYARAFARQKAGAHWARSLLITRQALFAAALALFALAIGLLPGCERAALAVPLEPLADVELFTREGCPRCDEAKVFVAALQKERPALSVRTVDVAKEEAGRDRLRRIAEAEGTAAISVPAFYVRGRLVIGYAGRDSTGRRIEAFLDGTAPTEATTGQGDGVCPIGPTASCDQGAAEAPGEVAVPLLGRLSVRALGLPLFTLALGLVDGFNPCAMWVLLFLLSFLVNLKSRRKMLLIAGVFVVTSGLAYFAFMAAWLNVFLLIGLSRAVQVGLGLIALVVGSVNIKDFFAFKKGLSFGIPERAKPTLYARMRAIVQAENVPAALASAVVLAVLVNVVELLCTAGLPALYTQVLAAKGLPRWEHYAYLTLYNIAYMADDMLMVGVAVVTLSRRKLQATGGRRLKLLSGAVMVLLGLMLLFAPGYLVL